MAAWRRLGAGGGCPEDYLVVRAKEDICKTFIAKPDGKMYCGTGFLFADGHWIFTNRHCITVDEKATSTHEQLLHSLRLSSFVFRRTLINGVGDVVITNDDIDWSFFELHPYLSQRVGNVDFAAIRLKASARVRLGLVGREQKYEAPMSFSVFAMQHLHGMVSLSHLPKGMTAQTPTVDLEVLFMGFPADRQVEQGPVMVRRRCQATFECLNGIAYKLRLENLGVAGGFSGSPLWCKVSTTSSVEDRWTLVGMLFQGTALEDEALDVSDHGITDFVLKDGGILRSMADAMRLLVDIEASDISVRGGAVTRPVPGRWCNVS